MSTAVIVVDKKRIKTCPEHFESDVTWRETAPGYESTQDCPPGYTGFAKRMCIMLDGNNPEWDTADMSECVSTNMGSIIRDVSKVWLISLNLFSLQLSVSVRIFTVRIRSRYTAANFE